MYFALASALAFAQLAAPATLQESRLQACLDVARTDPATAISDANQWLEGLAGPERSYPLQCLGFAYMSLLRWDAAAQSFVSARDARLDADEAGRGRLGGMAGNAALAAGDFDLALETLSAARDAALAAGESELAGTLSAERARALVALEQPDLAAAALAEARLLAPQAAEVWLLSATLARRMDQLAEAQEWIAIAARFAPADPAIGVEAGLIAALGGADEAARASWQSVLDLAPASPHAEAARAYLAQLDSLAEGE